jgi:hypothetical protein
MSSITHHGPEMGKMSLLVIAAIATTMTLSMHGKVLAASNSGSGEPGYLLTVTVPSHPFGTSIVGISITTANGYTDQANAPTSGGASWTFTIPPNQGNSVLVCVNSENSSVQTCHTYNTTGTDMSVSLSPVSNNGNSNSNSHHSATSSSNSNDNIRLHHGGGNQGSGGFNGHHGPVTNNPSGGNTNSNPSGGNTNSNPSGGNTNSNPSGGNTNSNPSTLTMG